MAVNYSYNNIQKGITMRYHSEYEVSPSFVLGKAIKWKPTGNGEFITAKKKGKLYFIKRNMHVRFPSADLPEAVREVYKKDADAMMAKQKKLRSLMKGLSADGDLIVVEEEHFFDSDNKFVTVSSFIEGALPEDYNYGSIGERSFLGLATRATKALLALHDRGIIHGDLKEKNFVVTRDGAEYYPRLIDFDASYPARELPTPDDISGSAGYLSPEVIRYSEREEPEAARDISFASDIFSLAIVFHRWFTGAFPAVDKAKCSVGDAVLDGNTVIIDSSLDRIIGESKGATYISLLNWMLAASVLDRPSAEEGLAVLEDKQGVPVAYHKGKDLLPVDKEVWDIHKGVCEIVSDEELAELGVIGLKKINENIGGTGLKYLVAFEGDKEQRLSVDELCERGIATRKSAELDAPWECHGIEFLPGVEISKKGYQKIRSATIGYRKRYLVTYNSGREIERSAEWLIEEGLAKQKPTEAPELDTPWPEHGKRYDEKNMAALGVRKITRADFGGEHRYRIEYSETVDGAPKVNERVSINNMRLMGFIR